MVAVRREHGHCNVRSFYERISRHVVSGALHATSWLCEVTPGRLLPAKPSANNRVKLGGPQTVMRAAQYALAITILPGAIMRANGGT